MSSAHSAATVPVQTTAPRVTAPSGTGVVVIPGGGVPGQGQPHVTQPQNPATIPGPQSDGSDFFGLAAAVVIIVVAILLVRRIVPLRRQPAVGRHPTQPPDAQPPDTKPPVEPAGAPAGQHPAARPEEPDEQEPAP